MNKLSLASLSLVAFAAAVPIRAGEPFVSRDPAQPGGFIVFEGNRRVGTIRPDSLGRPRLNATDPLQQPRYSVERSPFGADRYEVLRDGKRIGSVRTVEPRKDQAPPRAAPATELDLPPELRIRPAEP